MGDFKNLNISVDKIEKIIADFVSKTKGKYEIEEKPNKLYQFKIIIPGQKEALLNIYDTKKGITINPKVGANQELSLEIAELVRRYSRKVETVSQSFEGVFQGLFDEFIKEFVESGVTVNKHQENEYQEVYKLKNQHDHELTITYYKNKYKVFIQGKTTKLYDDVILWFADKILENPADIIEIIFKSMEDFDKYHVRFPEDLMNQHLKDKIGNIYDDTKALKDEERKWLKTSYYLLYFTKELPEYYPVVAGSIKVIEGILRRILIKKYTLRGAFKGKRKAFKHFRYDKNKEKYVLDPQYEGDFPNQNHKNYIEELYNFIDTIRNRYMHNLGYFPYVVEKREDAEKLLNEVIELIKKVEPFKDDLL